MLTSKIHLRIAGVAIALASTFAFAQQPAAPPLSVQSLTTFASSAEVAALIEKSKSERKPGQTIVSQKILQFAPYAAMLEYRPAAGNAALHETEAEMMYVIEGSATFVTGGKLVGTAIEGGTARKISKGDFLVVPEGTPHWFSAVDGTITLMTFKVPRGAAAR
jgi:mannose-6-phosphate isomerase-like protein (cupin superfamily)